MSESEAETYKRIIEVCKAALDNEAKGSLVSYKESRNQGAEMVCITIEIYAKGEDLK